MVVVKVTIYLKSGARVRFNAKEFSSSKSRLDGDFRSLEWTSYGGSTERLHGINLDEIAAITVKGRS